MTGFGHSIFYTKKEAAGSIWYKPDVPAAFALIFRVDFCRGKKHYSNVVIVCLSAS